MPFCLFSEDIGMEFCSKKCATSVIEKGKILKSVRIELACGEFIKSLQEGESYKYLGILRRRQILRRGDEAESL